MDADKRSRLPKWIDDADHEHPEAAACRRQSLEECWERIKSVCRAGMEIMSSRPDADVAFEYRAPLSEETVVLLARLRERYRKHAS